MSDEKENFELGEEVTSLAKSKMQKGTVVLSVRLPVDEFSALERVARFSGRIPSQIAREAIHGYLYSPHNTQTTVTISFEGGATMVTGSPMLTATASSAKTLDPRVYA